MHAKNNYNFTLHYVGVRISCIKLDHTLQYNHNTVAMASLMTRRLIIYKNSIVIGFP